MYTNFLSVPHVRISCVSHKCSLWVYLHPIVSYKSMCTHVAHFIKNKPYFLAKIHILSKKSCVKFGEFSTTFFQKICTFFLQHNQTSTLQACIWCQRMILMWLSHILWFAHIGTWLMCFHHALRVVRLSSKSRNAQIPSKPL